jgi:hypothetical protein
MNTHLTTLCLSLAGMLAFTGCNKNENSSASANPPSQASNPTNSGLPPVAQSAMDKTSNLVASSSEAGRTTVDKAVQSAGTSLDKLKASAPDGLNSVIPGATPAAPPATDNSKSLLDQGASGIASLSTDQVVQGLKEALSKGLEKSIASLGQDGGFLTNLNVKIPVPEKMKKVESILRTLKQDKLADDFINTMNHAAEQAVPAAASVFADSLKQMSLDNAKAILAGPNDAATQYFQKTTQTNLYARFYPIVQKATAKTGVTSTYKSVCEKANAGESLGGFGSGLVGAVFDKDSLDIDAYVTNKALDGLFKLIADEELKIRQNPVARTTETLQKVFGAIKL